MLLLFAASCLAFGISAWEAFLHALPVVSQTTLGDGSADWAKLQSLFGVVRLIGGSEELAWTLQAALVTGVILQLATMWRSKMSFALKAAALVTGALLCTPYLFIYDLVMLAVPMAFLFRAGRNTGELPGEMIGLAAASLLILIYPLVQGPVGWGGHCRDRSADGAADAGLSHARRFQNRRRSTTLDAGARFKISGRGFVSACTNGNGSA